MSKSDITSKEDIRTFVNAFYKSMTSDDLVGHIFLDVMHVDWDHHLPKMYDFWEMLLLDGHSYKGAPMQPHLLVNQIVPLTKAHFEHWITLFTNTIDSLFEGPKAEEAKTKAFNIAQTWAYKFDYMNKLDK